MQPLVVRSVSHDNDFEMFATFKAAENTPRRYSWVSKKHGIVDLFSVLITIADGEPEIVALKRNVVPVIAPRMIDENSRKAFGLSFSISRGIHPAWIRLAPVNVA
tara:strand:- start:1086 stop:1400 length:315 start_codon:yes stop_codon:yes gene_type:complete